MGFAKYQEDIVSRFVNDTLMHQPSVPVSRQKSGTAPAPIQPPAGQPEKGNPKMSSFKKFSVATPRPLPVIILADVSGSMSEDGKIEALNAALKDMIKTFTKESRLQAENPGGCDHFWWPNSAMASASGGGAQCAGFN